MAGLPEPVKRELESCRRAYKAGVKPALAEALLCCREYRHPPEEWMVDAMLEILKPEFMERMTTGRGRKGNPISRYRQDHIHYLRWDMVCEVREEQENRRQFEKELE